MRISENTACKIGLASLASSLILILLGILLGLFEPMGIAGITIVFIINMFLFLVFICGVFLWLKGWTRFKGILENPWLFLLYLGAFIFGAYWLYCKYPSDNSK